MIPNRDGNPSSRLSVLWAVLIRDKRCKRNPWYFVEAHATREVARAQQEFLRDPILSVEVRRCSVGEVV